MPESQTTLRFGRELLLEFSGPRRRVGILNALREAMASGRLPPGTRLPSSRALALDLGVARSTVTECYSELVAEGWLIAQQGSGTRVAPRADVPRPGMPPRPRLSDGLAPGSAEYADFPRAQWLAAARRALANAPHADLGYGDAMGSAVLRSALAEYLSRARGVRTSPERVVISAGFHDGLGIVVRALGRSGRRRLGIEEYGLGLYRSVITGAGMEVRSIRVDAQGARIDELEHLGVHGVLLTPAHQFPIGVALAPERRLAVLDWARQGSRFVLEDDYDGEFRFDRKPIGALQGLDPEHVIYFGTASKSLAPALRLGWIVLPESLVADVVAAKGSVDTVSVLDQLTLAEFIRSGAFDRHVRARRQAYGGRRAQLAAALAEGSPEARLTGMAAGLQAVVELPIGTESATVRALAARGLAVSGLSDHHHGGTPSRDALVINYSAMSESKWQGALEILSTSLGG